MTLEDTIRNWTLPSSTTEQEKQDRTERMVKDAIRHHLEFSDCRLSAFVKGSYANNTNVRVDSDVDIAVQCHEVVYWDVADGGTAPPSEPYSGKWTPAKLRQELTRALQRKFPGEVDTSGTTAIAVRSSTARVDADVVPCFDYHYYFSPGNFREGTRIFKKSGAKIDNYPLQQLRNGRLKNTTTNGSYKRMVRVMKRVGNAMAADSVFKSLPSYFVECLVYNCPDQAFSRSTWVDTTRSIIFHIWDGLEGQEPNAEQDRWFEVNECFFLFHSDQPWRRQDGRDFAHAAWNYLDFGS